MTTTLELPATLYDRAREAAGVRGVSVEQFIASAIEEKVSATQIHAGEQKKVQLPLVPSTRPGSVGRTPEVAAEILMEDDVSA